MTNIPKPAGWHRRPKDAEGPCPICGCPLKRVGEHRKEPEGSEFQWKRRVKGPTGYRHFGVKLRKQTLSTDWHKRPRGTKSACPICGCPFLHIGSHRAEPAGGRYKWTQRWKSNTGWKYRGLGVDDRRGYHHRKKRIGGMTDATRRNIARAAKLEAVGKGAAAICEALDVTKTMLSYWRKRYPELWEQLAADERAKVIRAVKATAGTDAVVSDPDRYLEMARAADRWAEEKGRRLFPANGKTTLTTFYETYYKPIVMTDPSPEYLEQFDINLRKWRLLTADPPLTKITVELLALFRDALSNARGLKPGTTASPSSVKNALDYVQRLLDKAGPAGPRNRDAAGLIQAPVPWVKRPKVTIEAPRIVDEELINKVYEACELMDTPTIPGVNPTDWWRCVLVLVYNTGIRTKTLLRLQWQYVDWRQKCLRVPGAALKAKRAEVFHLNAMAIRHLRRIETDRESLLAFPHDKRYLYHRFHRLQDLAGIPRLEHFGLKHLRKTLATNLCRVSTSAAELALGHTDFAVTKRHYIQRAGIVAEALDKLPQPAAFRNGKKT